MSTCIPPLDRDCRRVPLTAGQNPCMAMYGVSTGPKHAQPESSCPIGVRACGAGDSWAELGAEFSRQRL